MAELQTIMGILGGIGGVAAVLVVVLMWLHGRRDSWRIVCETYDRRITLARDRKNCAELERLQSEFERHLRGRAGAGWHSRLFSIMRLIRRGRG